MPQVAFVTGAASGIGFAISKRLFSEGWIVVMTDLVGPAVATRRAELDPSGTRCIGVELDVRDCAKVSTALDDAVARHGRLDLVVNSAGTALVGETHRISEDEWRAAIDVNLWGAINVTTSAYKLMLERRTGHLVNISSGAGLVPAGLRVPYTTAKHGVVGLSTGLRLEAAEHGIGVTVVCPGVVDTPIFDTATIVGASNDIVEAGMKGARKMSPDRAAELILKGVRRNRAVVPLTGTMVAAWWLYRLSPSLTSRLLTKNLDKWRRLIRASASD